MKYLPHNKKELKHIITTAEKNQLHGQEIREHNRKVRVNNMTNKIRVQNQITMDNHERFKNVALGYSIQTSRLMKFVQGNVQLEQVKIAKGIMVKIQKKLLKLESDKKKYDKHLTDSVYCKVKMQPYVTALESIIKQVDDLVKGQAHE